MALEHAQNFLSTGEDGASMMRRQQEKDELHLIILKLKQPYREVMLLYYLAQYSIQETAEILHIQEGAVKTRLHRGRGMLRLYLEEDCDENRTES